jgi:hypothetical protein
MVFIVVIHLEALHKFFNTFLTVSVETLFTLFVQSVDNLLYILFQFFPVCVRLKNI